MDAMAGQVVQTQELLVRAALVGSVLVFVRIVGPSPMSDLVVRLLDHAVDVTHYLHIAIMYAM